MGVQTSSTDRSTICSMKLVYLVVFVLAICAVQLKLVQAADGSSIEEECKKCKESDVCKKNCDKQCDPNNDLSSGCLICLLNDDQNAVNCIVCKSILDVCDALSDLPMT